MLPTVAAMGGCQLCNEVLLTVCCRCPCACRCSWHLTAVGEQRVAVGGAAAAAAAIDAVRRSRSHVRADTECCRQPQQQQQQGPGTQQLRGLPCKWYGALQALQLGQWHLGTRWVTQHHVSMIDKT